MLDQLLTRIGSGEAFQKVKTAVNAGQTAAVYDLCDGARVFLACWLSRTLGRQVVVIAANEASAMRMAEDSGQLMDMHPRLLAPDMPEFVQGTSSREAQYTRMETLLKNRSNHFEIHLELKNASYLQDFVAVIRQLGLSIDDIESNPAYVGSGLSVYSVALSIHNSQLQKYKTHAEIIEALNSLEYISYIEEM